jgi:hypothetical protein
MNKHITRKGVAGYAPTLAAILALALAFTFSCSGGDDPGSGTSSSSGSTKEKWCVGSIMAIEGFKACYKIGIQSQMLNIVITEDYCNANKPLMAITEEAPNKADCGSIYEDGTECILFGNDEDSARPCSDGLNE